MVFLFDDSGEVVGSSYSCVGAGSVGETGLCRGVDIDGTGELITDNCAAGLFCATLGSERRCRALCDGDAFGCGGEAFCRGLFMQPLVAVCTEADNCDLLEQDCSSGQGCYTITGGEDQLLSHCFEFVPPTDTNGEVGTPCEFLGDCVPGADCLPDPSGLGGSLCTALCDPTAVVSICTGGQQCVPLSGVSPLLQSVPGVCE